MSVMTIKFTTAKKAGGTTRNEKCTTESSGQRSIFEIGKYGPDETGATPPTIPRIGVEATQSPTTRMGSELAETRAKGSKGGTVQNAAVTPPLESELAGTRAKGSKGGTVQNAAVTPPVLEVPRVALLYNAVLQAFTDPTAEPESAYAR